MAGGVRLSDTRFCCVVCTQRWRTEIDRRRRRLRKEERDIGREEAKMQRAFAKVSRTEQPAAKFEPKDDDAEPRLESTFKLGVRSVIDLTLDE